MRSGIKPIEESTRDINWEDVERKISIILHKFNNINVSYKDDLAQELRIHAYYYSDDYYDLYRRAIDYWRRLTRKEYPEVPFIDLDLMTGNFKGFEDIEDDYDVIVVAIREALLSEEGKTNKQKELDEIAEDILSIICQDIKGDSRFVIEEITVSKYYSGRISVTYLDQVFTEINYKKLNRAVKRLETVASCVLERLFT